MAKRAKDLDARCRAARGLLVALIAGTALSACSDDGGIRTAVPRSAGSMTASASPSVVPDETTPEDVERLVTQRYLDFQRIVAETGASSDAEDPRLAEYATGAVLENLRGKLGVRQQAGTRLYGTPVPHVQSVSVAGDRATVRDCLDNSATGLMDSAGNKLSVGRDRQETTATLVLAEGAWKVSDITTVAGGGSC
jgi:hypothetical protein